MQRTLFKIYYRVMNCIACGDDHILKSCNAVVMRLEG